MYKVRFIGQTKWSASLFGPTSTCRHNTSSRYRVMPSYVRFESTAEQVANEQEPKGQDPLPKLPPTPASPTPYIIEEDFKEFVLPMYNRRWAVGFRSRDLMLKEGQLVQQKHYTPIYNRQYNFRDLEGASAFLSDIAQVANTEQHEPFVTIRNGSEATRVKVHTYTPHSLNSPSRLAVDAPHVGPGITLRDARLAILIEDQFNRVYLTDKRGVEFDKTVNRAPQSVTELVSKQRRLEDLFIRPSTSHAGGRSITQTSQPLPIPELPEAADSICTNEHFDTIITPLYTRGWSVIYTHHVEGENENLDIKKTPALLGFFRFTSFDAATAFAKEVLPIFTAEKISPNIWIDNQTVLVQVQSQNISSDLTVRDARFAVLVETLFSSRYTDQARGGDIHSLTHKAQPESVEALRNGPAAQLGGYFKKKMESKARRRSTAAKS